MAAAEPASLFLLLEESATLTRLALRPLLATATAAALVGAVTTDGGGFVRAAGYDYFLTPSGRAAAGDLHPDDLAVALHPKLAGERLVGGEAGGGGLVGGEAGGGCLVGGEAGGGALRPGGSAWGCIS